ncbi:hypothetical protein ALP29_200181 [Pseudomonas syringae pv. avii]|uniref:Uncharacterized protein n=1 Tax=Pseudomonas syringae pv. avii TaxID=663959 RepID=A0A3M5W4B9_PSESX|nr:hypothetical protein ALP29_200181 [Pseudomonas syringae pv. avii]
MLRGGVAATLAVRHSGHGRHTDLMQTLDGVPFLARPQHRQFCGCQVLGNFAPADAAVDLDEVATPVNFGAQRATTFQLAVDLTAQALDLGECIAPGPQALERFSKEQLHQ